MLNHCVKCSIYNLDKEFICDAQVSLVDETQASLALLDDVSDQLLTEVNVTFYDDIQGLVTYLCVLSGYREVALPHFRNYYSVTCRFQKQISVIQRRSDIKIKTDFVIDITTIGSDNHETMIEVSVKNMSAGGLYFETENELAVGSEFSFLFRKGSLPLVLKGLILRRQEFQSPHFYGYGCSFTHLSSAKEAIIREFVFREQVRQKSTSS